MLSDVEVIRAHGLAGVRHGFLGRRGGNSTGVCAGLNTGFGSGDDPALVARNRELARDAVAPGTVLVGTYQIHSAEVVQVNVPWSDDARPQADAMVTDRPRVALGILTADCGPVLLADAQAGVIGAAHAGWQGAFAGVLGNVVAAMARLGARRERIAAAIGPLIQRKSYEVDRGFFDRFIAADAENERFFGNGRQGHFQFDLEAYALARLAEAGVTRIEALGLDTYADADRFYSYRRATHRGEADYGRQLSIIALPA